MMVGSFLAQDLHPEDRLLLFGDDWDGEDWVKRLEPRVVFTRGDKAPYYGHAHLVKGLSQVRTSHFTFQDDDNAYTKGAFKSVRGALTDRPLVTGFVYSSGDKREITAGPSSGRKCIAGWQTWFPRLTPIPDFTHISDSEMIRGLRKTGIHLAYRTDLTPTLIRTDLASEEVLTQWVV
jgi:hypothetical protein